MKRLLIVALLVHATRAGAQRGADTSGVAAALRRYTQFTAAMASDSIGALYLPDGVLAAPGRAPIVGPAAVTAFLSGFSAYNVLAYATRVDSVRVSGDTVIQVGRWWQRVIVPGGDTVSVNGGLRAEWVRIAGGAWRVRRLGTFPLDAGPWPDAVQRRAGGSGRFR